MECTLEFEVSEADGELGMMGIKVPLDGTGRCNILVFFISERLVVWAGKSTKNLRKTGLETVTST